MTSSGLPDEKDVLELARNLLGTKRVRVGWNYREKEKKYIDVLVPGNGAVIIAAGVGWARVMSDLVTFAHQMKSVESCREADKKEAGA